MRPKSILRASRKHHEGLTHKKHEQYRRIIEAL